MQDAYEVLPFDQYGRQMQVNEILECMRVDGTSFTVLDVGGYKGITREVHKEDKVTVLDLFDVKEPNYVKGDGEKLPFDNDSFDFVVNFDVLEHVPARKRKAFINECIRVGKRGVIVAAPFKNSVNTIAEKALNDHYKSLHGQDHRWLKEHIEFGLPDLKATVAQFQENNISTLISPSNETIFWSLMQGAIFTTSFFIKTGVQAENLNKQYNQYGAFDGNDDPESNYRQVIFAFKNKSDYAKVDEKLSSVQSATPEQRVKKTIDVIHYFSESMAIYSNNSDYYEHELNKALKKNQDEQLRHEQQEAMTNAYYEKSLSWKLTKPIRYAGSNLRKIKQRIS